VTKIANQAHSKDGTRTHSKKQIVDIDYTDVQKAKNFEDRWMGYPTFFMEIAPADCCSYR